MTLEAHDLQYSYGRGSQVLRGVSAAIQPGSFLAVLGVNGSGKSTLLSCLDGVLTPQGGTVLLDERSLSAIKREDRSLRIAYVEQHSHANRLTVYDALLLGRKPHISGSPRAEDYDAVDQVIEDLGLENLALRYVDELSGGEYQKMIIGRAFVQATDYLLLDEPTNNLDMANQAEVMSVVRHAVDMRGLAAVAVMHDINLSLRYCDRFLFVNQGVVEASGDVSIVTPELIERVYGVAVDIIQHNGRPVVIPQ